MVRGEAAAAAAAYARCRPQLDVGIHLDLGEWSYAEGEWKPLYQVVPVDDERSVQLEIERQFREFRRLVGANPTHVDSHQHVHRRSPVREATLAIARSLGVPLRHYGAGICYCGQFYGQTTEGVSLPAHIGVGALIRLIAQLSARVTELACHPGFAEDLPTMYRTERRVEIEALCDPRARAALAEASVQLTRFSVLPAGSFDLDIPQ